MTAEHPRVIRRDRSLTSTLALCVAAACFSMGVSAVHAEPGAPAAAQGDPLHGGLPFFDARVDAQGVPTTEVQQAIAARKGAYSPAKTADLQRLNNLIPMLTVDDNPFYGTPHFVRSTMAYLTEAS